MFVGEQFQHTDFLLFHFWKTPNCFFDQLINPLLFRLLVIMFNDSLLFIFIFNQNVSQDFLLLINSVQVKMIWDALFSAKDLMTLRHILNLFLSLETVGRESLISGIQLDSPFEEVRTLSFLRFIDERLFLHNHLRLLSFQYLLPFLGSIRIELLTLIFCFADNQRLNR